MPNPPPASIHVKRHLTERELWTIAVALELLASEVNQARLDHARSTTACFDTLIGDDEMRLLGTELTLARKVKVCRSKRTSA